MKDPGTRLQHAGTRLKRAGTRFERAGTRLQDAGTRLERIMTFHTHKLSHLHFLGSLARRSALWLRRLGQGQKGALGFDRELSNLSVEKIPP